MYLYVFDRRYGNDRVVRCDECDIGAGDLVRCNDVRLLALGDEIAFSERVTYRRTDHITRDHLHEKGLLSVKTLQFLHRFVNERFTTYKNAVPLFLPQDLATLFLRKKRAKAAVEVPFLSVDDTSLVRTSDMHAWQQLIIFPDLRTFFQMTSSEIRENNHVVILHGQSTEKQKAEAFRGVKNGTVQTLLCTYSQIFQDRKTLSAIILIDQHTRRYKNQQDPRYYVPTVVEYMASLYGAQLKKTWFGPLRT